MNATVKIKERTIDLSQSSRSEQNHLVMEILNLWRAGELSEKEATEKLEKIRTHSSSPFNFLSIPISAFASGLFAKNNL